MSIISCLLRYCFDNDEEDEQVETETILLSSTDSSPPPDEMNRASASTTVEALAEQQNHGGRSWLSRLSGNRSAYRGVGSDGCSRQMRRSRKIKGGRGMSCALVEQPMTASPLTGASSFNDSNEIPSIPLGGIVLPGSELQKKMAEVMSKTLEYQDDECVICMEGFDASNPRMPTLCGCGENKTFFHLPCLYQWIEQNENCPSCRERLTWEEF
mmetsp:Transcript_28764/g.44173  ORF Transcript_28764/g.44173 Transcript_28764/m.44173 type:complete len:213 (+) Transcript_28764:366-1004(+)